MMRVKVLILGLICLLMLGCALSMQERGPINDYWQELFTEPIETVYVIMKDERVFHRTGHNKTQISMDTGRLKKALKEKGYEIKDIAVVVHNHLKVCKFSPEDYKRYRRLKKYGFDGLFLVYCHTSDKVYDIENSD